MNRKLEGISRKCYYYCYRWKNGIHSIDFCRRKRIFHFFVGGQKCYWKGWTRYNNNFMKDVRKLSELVFFVVDVGVDAMKILLCEKGCKQQATRICSELNEIGDKIRTKFEFMWQKYLLWGERGRGGECFSLFQIFCGQRWILRIKNHSSLLGFLIPSLQVSFAHNSPRLDASIPKSS